MPSGALRSRKKESDVIAMVCFCTGCSLEFVFLFPADEDAHASVFQLFWCPGVWRSSVCCIPELLGSMGRTHFHG